MDQRISNHRGMTLTELLISSVLVGIVIVGALSADYAIRSWQKRTNERAYVQQELMLAMKQILKDGTATLGFGIGAPDEKAGIVAVKSSSPASALLYFLQDPDVTVDDDEYYILYNYTASTGPYIKRQQCTVPPEGNNPVCTDLNDTFFYDTGPMNFFDVAGNGVVTISLETRPDPAAAEHVVKNPTYSLETTFLPEGLSQ